MGFLLCQTGLVLPGALVHRPACAWPQPCSFCLIPAVAAGAASCLPVFPSPAKRTADNGPTSGIISLAALPAAPQQSAEEEDKRVERNENALK